MEELFGVMHLGGDVRALTELENRLEHGRCIATRAGDDEAVVLGRPERLCVELARDGRREPADVLAEQRSAGRDCTRVARRVAVAVLHSRCGHDDVVDFLRRWDGPLRR